MPLRVLALVFTRRCMVGGSVHASLLRACLGGVAWNLASLLGGRCLASFSFARPMCLCLRARCVWCLLGFVG